MPSLTLRPASGMLACSLLLLSAPEAPAQQMPNRALATGKVASPASYASMTTPEGAAISRKCGIPGFITSNAWFPETKLSVTVLTNSGSAPSDELMAQLARLALGIPLRAKVK